MKNTTMEKSSIYREFKSFNRGLIVKTLQTQVAILVLF